LNFFVAAHERKLAKLKIDLPFATNEE